MIVLLSLETANKFFIFNFPVRKIPRNFLILSFFFIAEPLKNEWAESINSAIDLIKNRNKIGLQLIAEIDCRVRKNEISMNFLITFQNIGKINCMAEIPKVGVAVGYISKDIHVWNAQVSQGYFGLY